MTYHLTTFGCQMNYSDSERIASVLDSMGLKQSLKNKADVLIFNLCSVRQRAVDRIWGMIKSCHSEADVILAGRPRGQRKRLIILTGCILPEDKKKFKERGILILDLKDLSEWPDIIFRRSKPSAKKSPHLKLLSSKGLFTPLRSVQNDIYKKNYFSIPPKYSSSFTAHIPIMTGCDNFCSYCVVPYTRGREVSRPVEEVLNEVNNLIVQGVKEIILIGQNVNSYLGIMSSRPRRKSGEGSRRHFLNNGIPTFVGMTVDKDINFPNLLKLIDKIPGNYWLSFLTSHPKDMSDDLIKCFKTCKHLAPYLHLPLQSGSDKILKMMNRNYTAEKYLKIVNKIRKIVPDICLTSDLIVGFPGETEKDFLETAKMMKKNKFDMAYLAEYSPRSGTVAAKLKDNVPNAEKARRKNILNEILKSTALENNKKLLGKILDVLVESIKNSFAFGRTRGMKNVRIDMSPFVIPAQAGIQKESKKNPGFPISAELSPTIQAGMTNEQEFIGKFVKVKIIKAGAWGVEGELVI